MFNKKCSDFDKMESKLIRILTILFVILTNKKSSALDVWQRTKYTRNVPLKHFWKSTGLCPSSGPEARTQFLLSRDEQINIDLIGALPCEGISEIRIHWLLDLLKIRELQEDKLVLEFEFLDRLIHHLNRSNLSPIFELMGNPSNYFHDFKQQFHLWSDMLKQIINRYTGIYGSGYTGNWRFELTNEPDLKLYNNFNLTLEGYIDYFRASESGVQGLAGPAGLFRDNKKVHSLCWGLLDYCNSKPCNLDMITFHRKGDEVGSQVVERGLELINYLMSHYPNLKGVPFGNDEADIQTGWIRPFEWRADVRYAALVVQVVIGHIQEMLIRRNIPFELLSNDNAFLSYYPHYFTQRTLFARFQINNTSPPHVQFFRKPIYSVMALLALLGNEVKDIQYQPGERGFSYVVTSHKHLDSFLGVLSNDRVVNETYEINTTSKVNLTMKITLRNSTRIGFAVGYIMDNDRNSPYHVWRQAGSPDFPKTELRRKMRRVEGFRRIFIRKVKPNQRNLRFNLKDVLVPSVISINSCYISGDKPGPVNDLHYANIFLNEILLLWRDTHVGSCILTYVVEYKSSNAVDFQRINSDDSIFLSYHFDGSSVNGSLIGVKGQYRVAAMDYWNRIGPFSNILTVK